MTIGNVDDLGCTKDLANNVSIALTNTTCQTGNGGDRVTSVPSLIDTNFILAAIYIGIMSGALLTGTFGNIMILLVSGYERGLNKVGKQFMVNLALADLCVSAVADPMCIVGVVKGEYFFDGMPWLCITIASLCLTACFCAFLSLTMLSINRYVYLCHNSWYDRLYGRKACIALCIICWVVAFLLELPNYLGWGGHYFDKESHQCAWDRTNSLSYNLLVSIGLIGFPLGLMTVCYLLIFGHIWNTKKNLYIIDTGKPEQMGKIMKETARTSKTLFGMFVVFVVCWTPYAIVIAIDAENKLAFEVHLMITLMAHMHSSCNFVIYCIANKRFRATLARILGCRHETPLESETKSANFLDSADKCNNFASIQPQVRTNKGISQFISDSEDANNHI